MRTNGKTKVKHWEKYIYWKEKGTFRKSAPCQHVETRGVKIRKAIIGFQPTSHFDLKLKKTIFWWKNITLT